MTGTKKAKGGTANISKTTKATLPVGTCNLSSSVILVPVSGILARCTATTHEQSDSFLRRTCRGFHRNRRIMSSETAVSASCSSLANDLPPPNFHTGLVVSFVLPREHYQWS